MVSPLTEWASGWKMVTAVLFNQSINQSMILMVLQLTCWIGY